MGSQTHQLDRLGRELKCPICLSLLQQAASLTCNHTFCRSCILQSMKTKPACPICKVHTTRREVRAAPQMDSLVAIFVSMGSAAGLDIMASQPPAGDSMQAPIASKSRTALSNITNQHKSLHISNDVNCSDYSFKGAIPAKKRIQVPQPCSLQKELEVNRDDTQSTPQLHVLTDKCKLTAADDSSKPCSRKKSQSKRKGVPVEVDASRSNAYSSKKIYKRAKRQEHSVEPSPRKQLENEVLGSMKKVSEEAPSYVQASLNKKKHKKKKEKGMVPSPCGVKKNSSLQLGDESSRKILHPFFWLRDESSQERDAIRVTQVTQTQSTMRPEFSDLKDSDEEMGLDANEEIGNGIITCEPGSYDSDDFDWTQHPSSPELRCSPSKNQGITEDLVIDISLEASHTPPKELSVDAKIAHKRHSQDISTEAVLESASKVSSIAQKHLDASPREDRKRKKSGKTKTYKETQKFGALARDVQTQNASCEEKKSQDGCSSETLSKLLACDGIPSEKTEPKKCSANRKRNAKKPNKPKSIVQEKSVAAECSIKPTSTNSQPCSFSASKELKLSARNNKDITQPGKFPKQKHDPESNPGSVRNDNASSKPENSKNLAKACQPRCVFCNASKYSQVTGSMMHFNEQGISLAEAGQDEKIVHVHKHCAEWAPDVYFVKDEVRNLFAEAARGLKIKCFSCGKRGAALGCCLKRCRRSYHYPCARALSCRWEEERFIMLCPEHKAEEFPVKKSGRRRVPAKTTQKSNLHIPNKQPNHAKPSIVKETPVRWTNNQFSKWVLCGSALDSAGKEQVATFAKVTGATVSKVWSSNVTHVIAGTDQHGAARRTMKFLMAILEGKWVVKLAWLAACIEAGKPVSEEPFEIGVDIHGAIEGPKLGRLQAAGEGQKLFGKLQFYFMPDFLPSYKGDLQALVIAGGGGVLHRKPVSLLDDNDAKQQRILIVYNSETPSEDKKADKERLLNRRKGEAQELAACVVANVVSHQWILDSIGASKMQPLEWVHSI